MAEKKSKFAALADLHRAEPEVLDEIVAPLAPPEEIEPTPVIPVAAAPQVARVAQARRVPPAVPVVEDYPKRGRPPTGKRSNPEWRLYSHYLKRQTQRAAVAKLQALDDGRDLSDVIEELLQIWLKK